MKTGLKFSFLVLLFCLFFSIRNVNAEIVSGNKFISGEDISLSSQSGVYYNLVYTTNSSTIIREYNIEFNNMLVDNSHDYIRFILLFYRLGRTANTEISAGVNCKESGGCWEYDTSTVQYFDNDFTPMVRITYDYSGDHHICTVKNSGFGFLSVDCPLVSEQPHVTKITIRVPGLDNYSVGTILYGVANFANYIDNDSSAIINEQQETNDKLDEIQGMDINDDDKELPDDSSYQEYSDVEGDLLDYVGEADTSSLDIAIDVDSSNFVWDTLTDLIQSHALVFSTVIAILSIGIIKLALGR